ncbi:MAG: PilW family protein [Sinimarinibacterium flocculans]|uniref:PilW family protein n=1 Tax=Sinimarinibacterium flocculans TaxID=985250 RepID=UPI003C3EF061
MSYGRARSAGLSLVELMIGMALGLILVLGVTQIFISNKQGYRVQESNAQLQENARFALEHIGRILRHADFWAGVDAANVLVRASAATPSGASTCNSAWILDVSTGLRGYDGGTAPPIDCIASANYVPNTDVVVSRYADPAEVLLDSQIATLQGSGSRAALLRTLPGQYGILFNAFGSSPNGWSAVAGSTSSPMYRVNDTIDGYFNHVMRTDVLFLRPCSTKASSNCTTSSDGGTPTPTLVVNRLTANGSSPPGLVETPLVEYVEQLQLQYGIDTNADKAVDRYYSASAMPLAAWSQVIMVRAGVIVRGPAVDNFTDTDSYALPGGYTYTPDATLRRYPRRMVVKDFQVRNRVRG